MAVISDGAMQQHLSLRFQETLKKCTLHANSPHEGRTWVLVLITITFERLAEAASRQNRSQLLLWFQVGFKMFTLQVESFDGAVYFIFMFDLIKYVRQL